MGLKLTFSSMCSPSNLSITDILENHLICKRNPTYKSFVLNDIYYALMDRFATYFRHLVDFHNLVHLPYKGKLFLEI